jgi:hypothetical protein
VAVVRAGDPGAAPRCAGALLPLVALWLGLLALAIPPAAGAADFLDLYKQGLEAAEQGDWARSAARMEEAIAARPEESGRLVGQLWFKPYLPHYRLGVVRSELGDCRAALAAFAESERQGVIAGREEAADLAARSDACRGRLAAVEQAAAAAEAALAEAEKTAGRVGEPGEIAELEALGEPDAQAGQTLAARRTAAGSRLDRARERFGAGRAAGDRAALEAAAAVADDARLQLEELATEAARRRRLLADRRADAAARLDAAGRAARQALAATEAAAPATPEIAARRAEVEALLAEAARGGADPQDLAGRLDSATGRLRDAAEPPPAGLVAAAEAYFAGDYAGVLAALGDPSALDRAALAHAELLRAAASFALAAAPGPDQGELLERARSAAAACRAADPSLEPPAALFSPRFRAFFAEATGLGG